MRIARTIAELSDIRDELTAGQPRPTVAFVPTMGALHAGHLSLFRIARNVADVVVVSIFVNPLQFGPDEDYARYPRVLEQDFQTCQDEDIDIVFAPTVTELYPAGRQVTVSAGHLGALWEGRSRPGHFDGVLTVVSKLLNIVRPDKAIFGQKDAQQLAVIRKMASDLNIDVDIVAAPTIREEDGLALSSRNRYLLPHERKSALAIWHALAAATREDDARSALDAAQRIIDGAECDSSFRLDYLAWVNPQTFAELDPDLETDGVLLIAARVGDTRLMDNVELSFSRPMVDEDDVVLDRVDERVSF